MPDAIENLQRQELISQTAVEALGVESVSITSSLVMPRSTFTARHSRVYSSTIDSHFNWLPLTVRS